MATPSDRTTVLTTIVAAFREDPLIRWFFPDDAAYPTYADAFFGGLFDRRVEHGTIWTIDGAAVAMWAPPGSAEAAGDPVADLAAVVPPDALARLDRYEQVLHPAMPPKPYWYLGVLATHPDHTGQGRARAVMTEGLRRAASDGLPAVLETCNPANLAFYRRAGWEVVAEVAAPVPTWILQQSA
ncbi:UNVERIFIED_CONTAM: acetyltransferase [Mumia flava]